MDKARYKLIIFDFDGTLADTSLGIINCHKYANVMMGREEPSEEILRNCIGSALLKTYSDTFGFGEEATKAVAFFRKKYAEKGIYELELYEGIKEVLCYLKEKGYKLGIASLKLEEFVKKLTDYFEISKYFDVIHGVDSNDNLSKADLIKMCIEECGETKESTVMVGDSINDYIGAKKAGVNFLAVTYGFGLKDEIELVEMQKIGVAFEPKQILEIL